jgi:hypothetical protein
MIRNSSPSIWISVPAYLPYSTVSPTFTVTGSSFLPGPAATTVPRCGFSFAVSGMIIPPAVFSSAGAGFTITLSAKGVTFNFLPIVVSIFVLMKELTLQEAGRQRYSNFIPNRGKGHIYRFAWRPRAEHRPVVSIFQPATGCLSGSCQSGLFRQFFLAVFMAVRPDPRSGTAKCRTG